MADALGCGVLLADRGGSPRADEFFRVSARTAAVDLLFLAGGSGAAALLAIHAVSLGVPIAHIGGGQVLDSPAAVYLDIVTRCAALHFAFCVADATRLLWRVRAPEDWSAGVATADDLAPARGIHVVGHPALDGLGLPPGPLGDGHACDRIRQHLEEWHDRRSKGPCLDPS